MKTLLIPLALVIVLSAISIDNTTITITATDKSTTTDKSGNITVKFESRLIKADIVIKCQNIERNINYYNITCIMPSGTVINIVVNKNKINITSNISILQLYVNCSKPVEPWPPSSRISCSGSAVIGSTASVVSSTSSITQTPRLPTPPEMSTSSPTGSLNVTMPRTTTSVGDKSSNVDIMRMLLLLAALPVAFVAGLYIGRRGNSLPEVGI